MRAISIALVFGAFQYLHSTPAISAEKIGDRLSQVLRRATEEEHIAIWVYFTDKGLHELSKASVPLSVVSDRSLQRRRNVRPENMLVDATDLPVDESYIEAVASQVIRVRQRSKWFNSVSVLATKSQIVDLEALPFVAKIDLLARFRRDKVEVEFEESEKVITPSSLHGRREAADLDYGASFDQVNQINVPAVHNTGNFGQGVTVGVFDNGFRLLNHQAFDSMSIIATYDFVDHKVNVKPNNTSPSFGAHGILTLSNIGGYRPGQLIGPAFGANYVLARTENDSSETPIEEDNWVAAIEWADSIGVQVTTTSLGYLDYDLPYPSWTWQDMNGNTTVITRAADMAVGKGIVVVNSAGNNGPNTIRNTLNAPADGDSVLAIGAVNASGSRSSFSSVGPTTSSPPRIKPDVMARGSSVRCASGIDTTGYVSSQGTSHSCPLVAGVVALLLRAKPNATPMQVINALRQTASQANAPDNLFGWGIVNAAAAISLLNVSGNTLPTTYRLFPTFPNPFNPSTSIPIMTVRYEIPEASLVTFKIYDVLGREVRTLVNEQKAASLSDAPHSASWDGRTNAGANVASGTYLYRLTATSTIANSPRVIHEVRKLLLIR